MKEENKLINTTGALEKVDGKEDSKEPKKERGGNDTLRTATLVGTAASGSAAVTAALSLDDDADVVEADELLVPEEEGQEAGEAHSARVAAEIPETTAVTPVEGDDDEIEVVNPDEVMIDEEQPAPQSSVVEEETPIEPEAPAEIPSADVDIDDIM